MKTYNEFRSKAFDWLGKSNPGLKTALRYVMSWEPEYDCNTELAFMYWQKDVHTFSQCIRRFSKYKIT